MQAARHAADELVELMPFPEGYEPQDKDNYDAAKDAEWICAELGITRQTLYRRVSPTGELRPDGLKLLADSHKPR